MPDGESFTTQSAQTAMSGILSQSCIQDAAQGFPFLKPGFFKALEEGNCLGKRTGWHAAPITLENDTDQITSFAPAFSKTNSWGEYVFDHTWADAYMRAGAQYYPKLQIAVPFTPATGPKLLGDRDALLNEIALITTRQNLSSAHITFCPLEDTQGLPEGWLNRLDIQYHWQNNGYKTFDDFLAALKSSKRKMIKKERKKVENSDVKIHMLRGDDIREEHWHIFFDFYIATIEKKWSAQYLTPEFFQLLGQYMAEDCLLVMAEDSGQYVAGALNLIGPNALYGRYWGSRANYKFLHFECCYYRAIDYAIEQGLQVVEAGAQGAQQKHSRGYDAHFTHSLHYIPDPNFSAAIDDFLKRERFSMMQHKGHFDAMSIYANREG